MILSFVDHSEQHIHQLMLDVVSKSHKFAVDSMENSFKIIPFPWIFTVKQFQEAIYKVVIQMSCNDFILKMRRKNKLQKELVYEL